MSTRDAAVAADAAKPRVGLKQWFGVALGLLVLALGAWGLSKIAGQVTIADVMAEVRATPVHLIVAAAVSAAISYVVLVGYDWLATRHLGYTIGWPTLAAASFASFTMSHTLGVTVLTGGTVRYRIYTRAGVKAADIAMIILLCGWTFWLGIVFVAGVGLLAAPDLSAPFREFAPAGFEHLAGLALLAGTFAYLLLATVWRREFRILRYAFTIPDGRETLLQIVIGAIDLAFAGGALFLLLLAVPGTPDLLTFLTIYAVAMVIGALSHAPGGLGVFEIVVVSLMPDADKAGVLLAVAPSREIYTFIPFLLGLVVIAVMEANAVRKLRRERRAASPPAPANRA
ncbi:membrane protein [Polymorphobacter multimanifer]|uniref:lysylphosphatidylglycerol synthase domain-containing protein n=1 Tax=Polymorphobacter multimanifer TaxID=1070431 RepID=UPI0016668551|nr:lysylphosphatidylglycerol synthase domain-containing protein [Polymorphobacter multimanifer]GGI74505.1 membrane protein [Polymorphobacter multimanifer]